MTLPTLSFDDVRVDLASRMVHREGEAIVLSEQEARVLELLARDAGRPVPRDVLLSEGLGYRAGLRTRAIDNLISRLRRKLEPDPEGEARIRSVYGLGYQLDLPDLAVGERGHKAVVRPDLEQQITCLLARPSALVCLYGPGGAGKTHLLHRLAARRADLLLVGLGGVHTRSGTLGAVAEALQIPLPSGTEADRVRSLAATLTARRLTLALDHAEHVTEALDDVLTAFVQAGVAVVVGSRRPLDTDLAQRLPIPPLQPHEAVALFVDRARRVRPQFEPTPEELAQISAVVDCLDGLPLAIELAACRVGTLSLPALLRRVREGLDVLVPAPGDTVSLPIRSAIGWSWSLLSAPQQRTLVVAALFVSAFDADMLCRAAGDEAALEHLESLVLHALVRREGGADPMFRVLDTVRAFTLEQLASRPDRHALVDGFAAVLAEEAERRRAEAELKGRWGWFRHHRNSLIEAWRLVSEDRPALGFRVLLALDPLLDTHGPPDQREALFRDAARRAEDADTWCDLEVRRTYTLWSLGRVDEAVASADGLVARLPQVASPFVRGLATHVVGCLHLGRGRLDDAEACFRQAIPSFEAVSADRRLAISWYNLAAIAQATGRPHDAAAAFEVALRHLDRAGDEVVRASVYTGQAVNFVHVGRLDEARELLERALAIQRRVQPRHALHTAVNVAYLHLMADDAPSAAAAFDDVFERAEAFGEAALLADISYGRALTYQAEDRPRDAWERLLDARRRYRGTERVVFEGQTELQLGITAILLGHASSALERLQAAVGLLEPAGSPLAIQAKAWMQLLRDERVPCRREEVPAGPERAIVELLASAQAGPPVDPPEAAVSHEVRVAQRALRAWLARRRS